MFETHRYVFRLILTRNGDPKSRSYTGVFYIGVGDQFDDDRRFVCGAVPGLRPAIRPARADGDTVVSIESRSLLRPGESKLQLSAGSAFSRFCKSALRRISDLWNRMETFALRARVHRQD
jgi:hypothetical protein